jgi:YidC/Oxa1 family membrane protein insertase
MERRLLVAILLTFVVLTAYQWLVPTPPSRTPATQPAATPAATPSPAAPARQTAPQASIAALPVETPVDAVRADTAERTVTIDNGLVRAVFSSRGATLASWQLLRYHDAGGKPLDLVAHDLPATSPKPFSLKFDDATKSARVNTALYVMSSGTAAPPPAELNTPLSNSSPNAPSSSAPSDAPLNAPSQAALNVPPSNLDARTTPITLAFEYQDVAGVHVRKQFRLDPNSYVITFSANVTDAGAAVNPLIQWGPGLGDVLARSGGGGFTALRGPEAIFSVGGGVERLAPADLRKTPGYQGVYDFAGVDTHYFISCAVKPGNAKLEYYPLSLPAKGPDSAISRDYIGYDIRFSAATGGPQNARFFVGPKHFETLQKTDPELVRAIWFGRFSFLSVPLLSALNWVNGFVGNYGWSIIVLTVIINAAMFPLRHKSFVSMRKMQEIQPQVKAIQDRYAKLKVTDPARQKMNTELMELYRQKGVNPASGCIPMLLTLPVLLAFYGLLSESVELRGAPFILWIKDLAAMDPYYVTPILMGASQVVQQKMTPMTGADPIQQKMMLFMPIMFTFLFLRSPSGLALYWFASNVLVIVQQIVTNKLIGPPVVRTPRPPAERRLKKVGEGKTEGASSE